MQVENSTSNSGSAAPSAPVEHFDASGVLDPLAGEAGGGQGGSGDGGGATGTATAAQSAAQAPPTAPTAPSWRDQAKNFGLDLSQYEKDEDALKFLADRHKTAAEVEAARQEREQYKQLAQYGNEYLQFAPQFRAWYADQQKLAQQQQQQADADPYARPEFDPRWEAMVEYDQNGVLVPNLKMGGTPEIVSKMQQVLQWRRGFLAEPDKYLGKTIESRANDIAKKLFDERIAELRREQAAQNFLLTNRDWLFKAGPNGAQELSDDGKELQALLKQYQDWGYSDEQQQQLALHALGMIRKLRGGAAAGGAPNPNTAQQSQQQQGQQQTAQQAADATKADFLKTAAGHGASPAASTHAPLLSSDPPQNVNQSLGDMLRGAFNAAGVDDATFANI